MDGIGVAAALLSALLHAGWNAAVKASPDPAAAMTAQVVASGLLALPFLLVVPWPSPAALPWIAASTAFNLMAMLTLLQGYARGGGFGLVYPLTRVTSPLLVALFAALVLGEQPSPTAMAGIALISCGIVLFAAGDARKSPAALLYGLAAGALSAAYAVSDAQGARLSPSALGYGLVVAVLNAAFFGTLHRIRTGIPVAGALRRHPLVATLGSGAAMLSYLLILWAWSRGPIAPAAALRDTSMVFGALIAAFVLKEQMTGRRAAAIGVVAAGAAILRFA